MARQTTAFSPAHITGFFQICDQPKDPLLKGSRGAGFCLTKGVKTNVNASESAEKTIQIKINGRITRLAEVSESIIESFMKLIEASYRIEVEHQVEVPIGCGFGTSGAGALSLALALNRALNLDMPSLEAAQIAHTAEITYKTGLGTVIAETYGGAEIRTEPGAPGVGKIEPIEIDDKYTALSLSFGPLSTRKALTDPKLRKLINSSGEKLTDQLITQPTITNFLKLSREFAESTKLISQKAREVLVETDSQGFKCSVAIFGNTVFSLVKLNEAEDLLKIFKKQAHNHEAATITNAEIDFKGARIIT